MNSLTLPMQYDFNAAYVRIVDGVWEAWTYVHGRKHRLQVPNNKDEALKHLNSRNFDHVRLII